MTDSRQLAQATLDEWQPQVKAGIPPLGIAMFKTYSVPLFGILAVSIVAFIASQVLPGLLLGSTSGNLATMALNLLAMYLGWRWGESRWHGTGLFVLYSRNSKERRVLEGMLSQADDVAGEELDAQRLAYVQSAEHFLTSLDDANALSTEQA